MMNAILQYIRDWFPPSETISRKRKGSSSFPNIRNAKYRRTLSPSVLNVSDDDIFASPLRSSVLRPLNTSRSIVIDDDEIASSKPIAIKPSSRMSSENRLKMNGSDDLNVVRTVKSTTEKRLDAKKSGYEYITRFSTDLDNLAKKSPNLQNGTKSKTKVPTKVKTSSTPRLSRSITSPTLDYSIRLDDKKRYQELLDSVTMNGSSIYGTPVGSFYGNRSRNLVELARTPQRRSLEVIDLTFENNKSKLSTKDRVIKVLDDFDAGEQAVIDDSDSDVEILPTPPSPKPDIKVEPVNSLKTVVDTSKVAATKWLDDFTRKHESFVEGKNREVQAYNENSSALSQINNDLLLKSLANRVKHSLAIKEAILPIDVEEEEVELPALTNEHLRLVKKAFSGDPNEILSKKFNLNVNRRDIQTLAGLNWLNDNVINFYMNLIIERGKEEKWPNAYAMNTFFYQKLTTSGAESLKRWTRRVDLFAHEFICVPIHLGMHWCMAIINLKEKYIRYYDSMGKSNNRCLEALRDYLEFEHMDKKKEAFSTDDFVLENVQDIPQQMNGSDCGMFSCTFAEFATRKAKFTFQQEDMPYLRKKMVVEILTGELLIQ